MTYVSINFALLVVVTLLIYYCFTPRFRWVILLLSSLAFYLFAGKYTIIAVLISASATFLFGRILSKEIPHKKAILVISYVFLIIPWVLNRFFGTALSDMFSGRYIAVIGISFYTLEMIAYLTDIYKKECKPENNYFHFLLFSLFFPKIIQGPICRYEELAPKLFGEHYFDAETFTCGFMDILWGCFLKFVIADKCRLITNPVLNNFSAYDGLLLVLTVVFLLIILYTDFLSCVMITKGVAALFGIDLFMNFQRPLFATSFKDFWKKWHISLSQWLSRYIYVPLGGNRKGNIRRFINLLITFLVSALWHGTNTGFLIWGLLQVIYRMTEEISFNKNKSHTLTAGRVWLGRIKIWVLYGFSMIFFYLPTAGDGFHYIKSIFNFTGFQNILETGLIKYSMGYKEFLVLLVAILSLFLKEYANEKNINFKQLLIQKPFWLRLVLYVSVIFVIVNFGTYGYGYNPADFIYGGF